MTRHESQMDDLTQHYTYRAVHAGLLSVRRRERLAVAFRVMGVLLIYATVSLLLRCGLDHFLQFNWTARVAFLAADVVVLGLILRRFAWNPCRQLMTTEGTAVYVQKKCPALQSRLISSIQLVPDAMEGRASVAMVRSLLEGTAASIAELDWRGTYSLRRALQVFCLGLIGCAFALLAWGASPAYAGLLVERYFLSKQALPNKTQINIKSGDRKVPQGESVRLEAEILGRQPDQVFFFVSVQDGPEEIFPVELSATVPGMAVLSLDNIEKDFVYRLEAGDATSAQHTVTVLPPPEMRGIRFDVFPPQYTKREPYEVRSTRLSVPEGSSITLSGQSTAPLAKATVSVLTNASEEGNLQAMNVDEGSEFKTQKLRLPVASSGLRVVLTARNGMVSTLDDTFQIKLEADEPPTLEIFEQPPVNSTLAPGQQILIRGRLSDDYGLTEAKFCYQIASPGGVAEAAVRRMQMPGDLSDFAFSMPLVEAVLEETPSIVVKAGGSLTWWLEAKDNCAMPRGTQIAESSRFRHQIVSVEQKIDEIARQIRSNILDVRRIRESQMKISEELERLSDPKNGGNP